MIVLQNCFFNFKDYELHFLQLNSLFSNGITYDDFKNGYFFAVYDLSTSGRAGTNFVVPAIRVGHLRVR
jgi:hypothetical protein